MKEEVFFRQAHRDPIYRQQKIAELLYHRKFTLVVLVSTAVLAIGFTLYTGLSEGRWLPGLTGMWSTLLLGAWVYTLCGTRLAALRAMTVQGPEPEASS